MKMVYNKICLNPLLEVYIVYYFETTNSDYKTIALEVSKR